MDAINAYLIDDSDIDLVMAERYLKRIDNVGSIKTFTDPTKAITEIHSNLNKGGDLPDLILLDIIMPEMDGFELIDELDEMITDDFQPHVFIISSTNLKRHFEDFEKQRISKTFLTKPLKEDMLKALISKHFPTD